MRSTATFLIGLIIGALATFSTFSGRVATLEATQQQQAQQLVNISTSITLLRDEVAGLRALCTSCR